MMFRLVKETANMIAPIKNFWFPSNSDSDKVAFSCTLKIIISTDGNTNKLDKQFPSSKLK